MKVWIGSDHGGFELKQKLKKAFEEKGCEITDVGGYSEEIVRYPYFAGKVAQAVAEGAADRGILICSTGIGMSVIANKYKGIRAALCLTPHMAEMTRRHNNSNVLCLGGKITGHAEALDMAEIWLTTEYEGGRHDISLGLIAEAEEAQLTGGFWVPELPMK